MEILNLPAAESEELTTAEESATCLQLVDEYNRCLRYINRKSFATTVGERLMVEAKLVLLRQGINQEPTEPVESEAFTIEVERQYYTQLLEWVDQRLVLCAMKDRCATEEQKMIFEANLQVIRDQKPPMDPDFVLPVRAMEAPEQLDPPPREYLCPTKIKSPHYDVPEEPVVIPGPEQIPE